MPEGNNVGSRGIPESLSALPRIDMIQIGAAVIFFISTFLPLVGASVGGNGFKISVSEDSWHSFAVLGVLIVLVAIALWAVQRFAAVTLPTTRFSWELIVPAAAAVGTVIILLRAVTYGSPIGLRYGFFFVLISGLVFAFTTYDRKATTTTGL